MTSRVLRASLTAVIGLLMVSSAEGARTPKPPKARPVDRRLAPEIKLSRWINTARLKPADLSGTARLVGFWTLDGVNAPNTVMAMRELHMQYAKRGLRVVGIHPPEFANQRDSAVVAAAVRKHGITFPVGLDDDHAVFDAFKTRHRPALYLIDRKGAIRSIHIGEIQFGTRAWNNFRASIESTLVAPAPSRRS